MSTAITDSRDDARQTLVPSTEPYRELHEQDRRNLILIITGDGPGEFQRSGTAPHESHVRYATSASSPEIEHHYVDVVIEAWTDSLSRKLDEIEAQSLNQLYLSMRSFQEPLNETAAAYRAAAAWLVSERPKNEPAIGTSLTADPLQGLSESESSKNTWLHKALEELELVDQEAHGEGFELPAKLAKKKGHEVLQAAASMGQDLPDPAVYPTEDREVAIAFQIRANKSSVLVLCDSNGGGACFSYISQKRGRARFDDASDLVTDFLQGQLERLTNS